MLRARFIVGFLTSALCLTVVAAGLSATGASAASGAPGDPVKGEAVYTNQKCSVCHRIGTSGGPLAPDLSNVGGRRNAAWLAKFLANPTMTDPKYKIKMPVPNVRGADMDNLIAYLLTLKIRK